MAYKTVAAPAQFGTGGKSDAAKAVRQYGELISREAQGGWQLVTIRKLPLVSKPGCLGRLMGLKATMSFVNMLVFYSGTRDIDDVRRESRTLGSSMSTTPTARTPAAETTRPDARPSTPASDSFDAPPPASSPPFSRTPSFFSSMPRPTDKTRPDARPTTREYLAEDDEEEGTRFSLFDRPSRDAASEDEPPARFRIGTNRVTMLLITLICLFAVLLIVLLATRIPKELEAHRERKAEEALSATLVPENTPTPTEESTWGGFWGSTVPTETLPNELPAETDPPFENDVEEPPEDDANGDEDEYAPAITLEALVLEGTTRYYDRSELTNKSEYELSILRNGMFALSGKRFSKNRDVIDFFSSCAWYEPRYDSDSEARAHMNDYQSENLDLIIAIEKEKGYR